MFTQMFTIHTTHNNHYIHIIFCLLPSKSKECYSQTFTHILNECNKRNFNCIPEIVYADFEVAIHTALLTVWPQINIKSCRFHLGQNWWRKIQNVGLSSDYKKNTTLGKYLENFFGLPFLPPNEVENCFTNDLLSIPLNFTIELIGW